MELLELLQGAVIFRAGDPATHAYQIRKGSVELVRGEGESAVCLARLEAGEVFGEMSLIEERPHSLSARAGSHVLLSRQTRDEFEELLTADPATFRIYLKVLFERLREFSAKVEAARTEAGPPASAVSVTIHPLTRRSAATLPHEGLQVGKFPFRIGRAASENEDIPLDVNDLWLIDKAPYNISRNHALLEREADRVVISDRGSSLGIIVNDVHIGGKSKDRQATLDDGDNVVVLGGRMSPYQFRIEVSRQ